MACFTRGTLMLAFLAVAADALRLNNPVELNLRLNNPLEREEKERLRQPLPMPESFRHHNIIMMGDSVDRLALQFFCKMYAGHRPAAPQGGSYIRHSESLPVEEGPAGAKFNHEKLHSGTQHLAEVCDVPDQNVTVLYLFHPGVLSVEPEAPWHALTEDRSHMYPQTEKTLTVVPSALDLVKVWWRPSIEQFWKAKPERNRPTILVAHSNNWDIGRAREYLEEHDKPYFTQHSDLEHVGWGKDKGIQAWDWVGKATTWVQAIQETIPHERMIWRTEGTCPIEAHAARADSDEVKFWKELNDEAAETVRTKIAAKEGPWAGVGLMDFRKAFDAKEGAGHCLEENTLHYDDFGLRAFWQEMFDATGRKS